MNLASHRSALILIALAALAGLLQAGCGKKAWPRPKTLENGIGLIELSASWDGDDALLEAQVLRPEEGIEGRVEIAAVRVYHASFPTGMSPCGGCPIEYRDVRDFKPEQEGLRIRVRVTGLRADNVHFFQARVVGEDGSWGHLSSRLRLPERAEGDNINQERR